MSDNFSYSVMHMPRIEKLKLIQEYTDRIRILNLHLNDIPLYVDTVYYIYGGSKFPLMGTHISILNYLIIKYNCHSVGATIESIACYLNTSPMYIINHVQQLVTIKLINQTPNAYLGLLYSINKTNMLSLTKE